MNFITKSWKGILLCLVIAVPCWFLGQTFPIIGGPVFGILAGMIITLLLKDKSMFQDGITFVSKKVLQYAVILLGFRTESLRDSGNRKTVTANYRNDDFNVPDHCISVT